MLRNKSERGDTLVEVLLATAILAFLVAACAVIMNSGLASVQTALERTQVQAAMQGQASILRALRDAALKEFSEEAKVQWSTVMSYATSKNSTAETAVCTVGGYSGTRFHFSDSSTTETSSWLRPQALSAITNPDQAVPSGSEILPTPGDGLWIEAYRGMEGGTVPYYDFYIKSCWENIGSGPKQELKTVVRLYGDL